MPLRTAAEFATLRQRRYGCNENESEVGVCSLGAAAVMPRGAASFAAASIAIPTARFVHDEVDNLAGTLVDAARGCG